jgi:putative ABC transport system permease protein
MGKGGIKKRIVGVILGSCLYRFIVAIALRLDVPAESLKLVSAIIVAVAIAFPYVKKQMYFAKSKRASKAENKEFIRQMLENEKGGA